MIEQRRLFDSGKGEFTDHAFRKNFRLRYISRSAFMVLYLLSATKGMQIFIEETKSLLYLIITS